MLKFSTEQTTMAAINDSSSNSQPGIVPCSAVTTVQHYKSNLRDIFFNLFEVLDISRTALGQGPFANSPGVVVVCAGRTSFGPRRLVPPRSAPRLGAEPIGDSTTQMATQIKADTEKFAKLVKDAKVTIE